MNFENYDQLFNEIISSEAPAAPYNDPEYLEYTQLNKKRQDRWIKKGEITDETKAKIQAINTHQKWILITEPWCGDAAHSTPFIKLLTDLNPKIEFSIQLRDSESEIDNYLTNGGKSIPKLIARDEEGKDLFVWGPRPVDAQNVHLNNLTVDKPASEKKVDLQKWYNQDKGRSMQNEIASLLNN